MFKYLHYMNIVTIKLLYKVPILGGGTLYSNAPVIHSGVHRFWKVVWLIAVASEISHKFAFSLLWLLEDYAVMYS